MNFNFVQGGERNLGKAVFTTVNWWSLSNFLPLKKGREKRSVPNLFGQDRKPSPRLLCAILEVKLLRKCVYRLINLEGKK